MYWNARQVGTTPGVQVGLPMPTIVGASCHSSPTPPTVHFRRDNILEMIIEHDCLNITWTLGELPANISPNGKCNNGGTIQF